MEPACQIKLEVFEGPLDLLLHLIQKNKLDIKDIPIALITNQYLRYLELMQALDVSVAVEYLIMAATLLHIKSRILLPASTPPAPDEDDPREIIIRPLQELLTLREAARRLMERPLLDRDVFLRPNIQLSDAGEDDGKDCDELASTPTGRLEVSLTDLVNAFITVLKNGGIPRKLEIERAKQTVEQQMQLILERLKQANRLSFFDLFYSDDRRLVIVTFLAILELAKESKTLLVQEEGGDIIMIYRQSSGEIYAV